MSGERVGLPEALERAARALRREADAIRPANGDPTRLAESLGPEGSARVLAWLLANQPEDGEELAIAWADDPQGAGQALLKLQPDALPKPARKILRRVMHALRTRGVALPEPAREEKVATLPQAGDDAIDEARVTPFDARGGRVVALAVSHPSGGVRLFQIAIDPARGVLDFEVLSAARRDVRRWLRETARGGPHAPVSVPPASARALVARAAAQHPASRTLPRGFAEWRSRCAEAPEGTRTPGELAREALGPSGDAAAAVATVERWIRGHAIGPWPAEQTWLQALATRVADAGGGVVVVSDAARREQVARAVDAGIEELAQGAFPEQNAQRLEEAAYVLWQSKAEEDARAALAAADALRADGAPRTALLRAFVETWLAPILREAPQQEAAASPLVKP
jgi:hypothetical protein